jgi:arginyl-tRNA synthetase
MLQQEQNRVADRINDALEELGFGRRMFTMRPIPFSGTWGTSSSISYQLANEQLSAEPNGADSGLSKKELKRRNKELVGTRAQEIAERVAEKLGSDPDFARIEATNGYINIEFDRQRFTNRVLSTIRDSRDRYGSGSRRPTA